MPPALGTLKKKASVNAISVTPMPDMVFLVVVQKLVALQNRNAGQLTPKTSWDEAYNILLKNDDPDPGRL